jgi:sugar lactone lactonase YvrE
LAGSGVNGHDDGLGAAASFYYPIGVAVDSNGNVYVADNFNHNIRKVSAGGVVVTFAGYGRSGSDDGIGSQAGFNRPSGVAVDANGNVYVADTNNYKIRKITSSFVVTTLAGSGSMGTADGIGAAASFSSPYGIAVDVNGNVFVSDYGSNKIRKITSSGVVTTLAGSGSNSSADGIGAAASFSSPLSVAVDSNGNVYVADYGSSKIRKVTSSGVVTTLAGSVVGNSDGTGSSASFNWPSGVAVDSNGNVFVADSRNEKIRKITPLGEVTTVAGSGAVGSTDGTSAAASFAGPAGVAVDSYGNVYVADTDNSKIRKIIFQ